MINFFSDLDNTLIYSHRVTLPGEYTPVEYLNGRVQSNMTLATFNFLSRAEGLSLIPLTTRTCEQYARLNDAFAAFGCRCALVCEGGILLVNGEPDAQWLAETIAEAGRELADLREAEMIVRGLYDPARVHDGSGIMLYVKSETPSEDVEKLSSLINTETLNIRCDSRKVYCIPKSVNKGNALKRFRARMRLENTVAAGDDIPDIPMLNAADAAILPGNLADSVVCERKYIAEGSRCFSDHICGVLARML